MDNNNKFDNSRFLLGWQDIATKKGDRYLLSYFSRKIDPDHGSGLAVVDFASRTGRSSALLFPSDSDMASSIREIPIGSEVILYFNDMGRCIKVEGI